MNSHSTTAHARSIFTLRRNALSAPLRNFLKFWTPTALTPLQTLRIDFAFLPDKPRLTGLLQTVFCLRQSFFKNSVTNKVPNKFLQQHRRQSPFPQEKIIQSILSLIRQPFSYWFGLLMIEIKRISVYNILWVIIDRQVKGCMQQNRFISNRACRNQ